MSLGIRQRINRAIRDPEIRAEFEEFKRLLGLAADRYGSADLVGHVEAATEAVAQGNKIASAVREQTGLTLGDEDLGKLLVNVAYEEMLSGPLAGSYRVPGSDVRLAVGRPSGRHSIARQHVIDAVAARSGISDDEIARLGRELDPKRWPPEQMDDYDSRRRRIARIRRDAAN